MPSLFSRQFGQGLPILLIHGWTMTGVVEATDFEPIFTTAAKTPNNYRRIYIDLPGMGSTPASPSITKDLDSMLESVFNFIEEEILPSKFLVTGSSCGAYIARAVAYKFANMVDGLLLRVPLVEPENSKRDIDPFVPAIADESLMSSLSPADREKLGDISVQTPSYLETFRRRWEDIVLPAAAASDSSVLDPIRNDAKKYILTAAMHSPARPFLKPTLIVAGRQDGVVGYRDPWSLMPSYPRATFAVLDRADHGLPVDENEIFEALVIDWLKRVQELRGLESK